MKKTLADTERINLQLEAVLDYISINKRTQKDIDSAFYLANAAIKIAESLADQKYKANCWCIFSNLLRQTGDTTKGRQYIDTAVAFFTRHNLGSQLADAYIELGAYYDAFDENAVTTKIAYYQKAMQLYAKENQKEKQAAVLKHIADFHQLQYKDSLALEELKQSLSIYQSIHYPKVQGVYDLMGYILYNSADYKQALKYGLLAVQTAEAVNCSGAELSTIYNRVGLVYYKLLLFDDALKYFNQAYAIARDNYDTVSLFIISPNIINSYLRLKKPNELLKYMNSAKNIYAAGSLAARIYYASSMVQTYLLSNQPQSATPYANELVNMAVHQTNTGLLRSLYRAIIPYHLAMRNYKAVYPYLKDNEIICRQNHILSGLTDNYLWWYQADSAQKNYMSALEHYKLYKTASDSALSIANNEQIDRLLIENETAKKDQTIALNKKNIELLTSQTKLQHTQLEQTRLMKNITVTGIIMLLLIVGLLYNRYAIKQRTNKQLYEQQKEINQKNTVLQQTLQEKNKLLEEKEWLVKEIHHRVKNNLQIIISLLSTQSKYLDNKEAIAAISESRHRMQAMSLIHQKLYQSENTSSVNMCTYITELMDYLKSGTDNSKQIYYELDIDAIQLNLSQAIPVGLILNEAITNAIKHAFINKSSGTVSIKMHIKKENLVLLEIKDNGTGIKHFDIQNLNGMGMRLIQGLTKQINGMLNIKNEGGVTVHIEFAIDKKLEHIAEDNKV